MNVADGRFRYFYPEEGRLYVVPEGVGVIPCREAENGEYVPVPFSERLFCPYCGKELQRIKRLE